MKSLFVKTLVITLLQLQAVSAFAAASPELIKAHEHYLKKDSQGMLTSLVEVMKRPMNQVEKENVNTLLARSFELNKGELKSDQQLPEGLIDFALVTRRGQKEKGTDYIVELKGSVKNTGLIKDLQLIKYPDQQILAKSDAQYEFAENEGRFYLKAKQNEPLSDGLYRVIIVMQNGQVFDTLLPLIDMAVSSSPQIISPKEDETTLNRNPEIHWQLFTPLKPTAYKSKITIEAVLSNPPDYGWDIKWSLRLKDLTRKSAVVGRESNQTGDSSLAPGRYVIMVNQAADRKYGPIRVSTQSLRRVSLFVR